MGKPIDPVFCDRDAFADFFTRYYTDIEPESALVALDGEKVVGYLLGCKRFKNYGFRQFWMLAWRTFPKMLWRMLTFRYNRDSFRFLSWFAFKSAGETPKGIPEAAHFHINFLDGYRDGRGARRLIFPFINELQNNGFKCVFGQMQVYEDRRGERLFERYGFKFGDRREITKFKRYTDDTVWVATIYRELGEGVKPMPDVS